MHPFVRIVQYTILYYIHTLFHITIHSFQTYITQLSYFTYSYILLLQLLLTANDVSLFHHYSIIFEALSYSDAPSASIPSYGVSQTYLLTNVSSEPFQTTTLFYVQMDKLLWILNI